MYIVLMIKGSDYHSNCGADYLYLPDHWTDHWQADNRVFVRDNVHTRRNDILRAIRPLRAASKVYG